MRGRMSLHHRRHVISRLHCGVIRFSSDLKWKNKKKLIRFRDELDEIHRGEEKGKIGVLIDFIIIVSYCSRYVRNMFEVKPESGKWRSDELEHNVARTFPSIYHHSTTLWLEL